MIRYLVLLCASWIGIALAQSNNNNECTIRGVVYQRGQSLAEAFETRCGVWQDYPCFCNPDAKNQVECPYCGFATTTPGLLRCAKHRQEVTFVSLDTSTGQRCTCDASDPSEPIASCVADPTAEVCSIRLPDDSIITRQPGQEIGRESRCGTTSEYPCRCDPNRAGQIDCPYCAHAAPNGGLVCLAADETDTFIALGDMERTCECFVGKTPSFPMQSTCADILQPIINPVAQCTFTNPTTGGLVMVDHGASLADLDFLQAVSPCGAASEWPCFCNTELDDQIECPYCSLPIGDDGEYLCGTDSDVLQVPQDDGTTVSCQCDIADAFTDPKVVCGNFPTPAPGCTVDFPNGGGQSERYSAGDRIASKTGPCGTAQEFPYVCNPNLGTPDNLEYPYCEVLAISDDNGGEDVTECTKDGGSVTFTNRNGERKTCDCIYLTAGVGGQTTCRDAPADPTAAPAPPRPTATPMVQSNASSVFCLRWNVGTSLLAMAAAILWIA
jgi:hypothetical protein